MALVTLLAVFPLALTINALLLPQLAGTPLVFRVLVFTGILTPTMTWVVMPALTRLLADWLYPSSSRRT
jgi:antibiotic biosynthesis monooxygenase (ABM) superfamily enzyme